MTALVDVPDGGVVSLPGGRGLGVSVADALEFMLSLDRLSAVTGVSIMLSVSACEGELPLPQPPSSIPITMGLVQNNNFFIFQGLSRSGDLNEIGAGRKSLLVEPKFIGAEFWRILIE